MNYPVLRRSALTKASRTVPYLLPEEVKLLVNAIKETRQGQRDGLLIEVLFQVGLRISEALSLTPSHIQRFEGKPVLSIIGKGKKPRTVAIPERLVDKLKSYAYEKNLSLNDKFFPINRFRGWQIMKAASVKAGLNKRVFPHLFRHSDAIERLKQTGGNTKALQIHLGHSSIAMTMRYLSTLTQEDAVRVNQEVQFE
jgi:integrase/recombinase XerD